MTGPGSWAQQVRRAAKLIADADSLVIAAGAGMGVDSGLPDFRGESGFWETYPALGARGMSFTEIASPAAFRVDPLTAWGFYGHRLGLYRRVTPHDGFRILLRWANRMPLGARVYTSNVDGQFQAAGFHDDAVYECHGSIHHLQCLDPCHDGVWPAAEFIPIVANAGCELLSDLPRCIRCGTLARPHVLMFDDRGWIDGLSEKRKCFDRWLESTSHPVVVEIGAGTALPSVRHFTRNVIRNHGGSVVRINPRDWAVPEGDGVGLAVGALDGLREIDSCLSGRQPRSVDGNCSTTTITP